MSARERTPISDSDVRDLIISCHSDLFGKPQPYKFEFSVLLLKEEGMWVAQCLQHDIAARVCAPSSRPVDRLL